MLSYLWASTAEYTDDEARVGRARGARARVVLGTGARLMPSDDGRGAVGTMLL